MDTIEARHIVPPVAVNGGVHGKRVVVATVRPVRADGGKPRTLVAGTNEHGTVVDMIVHPEYEFEIFAE